MQVFLRGVVRADARLTQIPTASIQWIVLPMTASSLPAQATRPRRLVIITEGHTEPLTAKTAACVIRYCPQDVVAVLDSTQPGKTAQELLGVGGDLPVIGALHEAPHANALLIGIAPAGGRLPAAWRPIVIQAIRRGMDIISGMHEFLGRDPELAAEAQTQGVRLVDIRQNNERDVAQREGIRDDCLRIQTVGNDCSVGKMVAAVEVAQALQRRGHDAQFVATGQTGIMIAGAGSPWTAWCRISSMVRPRNWSCRTSNTRSC